VQYSLAESSYIMTSMLRCKSFLAAALAIATACHRPENLGVLPAPGPRGVIVAPVRDYPFGDAVDVYRAALDLLYIDIDGTDRPATIVMFDSVNMVPDWTCPRCANRWPGKALVDTSTFDAFLRRPHVYPRLRPFKYKIPIHLQSRAEASAIWRAGEAYDAAHRALPGKAVEGFNGEFLRRFPGAWGTASFSVVGFNPAHTEAILQIRLTCGWECNSDELVFFRKAGNKWRAIERLTQDVNTLLARTRLSYRGPSVNKPGDSQLLVDGSGIPFRTEGQDAPSIYRLIVDSMYSLHGEHPRTLVVSDQHARANIQLLPYKHQIDSSTRATFRFLSSIPDRFHPMFDDRIPVVEITKDSIEVLDREGLILEKDAPLLWQYWAGTPFWLAFRKHYPGAWGYVELSRIGFNPEHTQALVYSAHSCGDYCSSGDVWFLIRAGEDWTIAERLSQSGEAPWAPDTLLRYIGRGADPRNNRAGRAQGIVSSFETGEVLPGFEISFFNHDYLKTIKTDARAHFVLEDLPVRGEIVFRLACPVAGSAETAGGEYLLLHPGLDTTVNVTVPFRACKHLNRADPLIAGTHPSALPPKGRPLPANLAGVYAGVLDALYHGDGSNTVPIMLEPFGDRGCYYCLEPEAPRLVRKGLMDPSTEDGFAKARIDTTVTAFPYRRKVEVMPFWDLYWLGPNGLDWGAMKDAYPEIRSVISFGKVGFNSRGTEALAEVYENSATPPPSSEVMLLEKSGAQWRVALRHVDRERTSGEWTDGRCEPGDVPSNQPTRSQIEKLAGEFNIVRVGASRQFRGRVDTVRIRIEPLRPSRSNSDGMGATVAVLGANGEPNDKVAAEFRYAANAATITFMDHLPPGRIQFDGWFEQYQVLGTGRGGFVGTWLTELGPTVPLRGYFCALPKRSKR
jgi:hypothetical protein